MTSKRVALLTALLCVGVSLYLINEGTKTRARALRTICSSIAENLLVTTNTNSPDFVAWLGTNFLAFRLASANVEAVKLGDKLSDALSLQAHANARLCLTNKYNRHYEIRIRDVHSVTNFTIIGVYSD